MASPAAAWTASVEPRAAAVAGFRSDAACELGVVVVIVFVVCVERIWEGHADAIGNLEVGENQKALVKVQSTNS